MRIIHFASYQGTANGAVGITHASVAAVKISFTWYTFLLFWRYIKDENEMINSLNYYT